MHSVQVRVRHVRRLFRMCFYSTEFGPRGPCAPMNSRNMFDEFDDVERRVHHSEVIKRIPTISAGPDGCPGKVMVNDSGSLAYRSLRIQNSG